MGGPVVTGDILGIAGHRIAQAIERHIMPGQKMVAQTILLRLAQPKCAADLLKQECEILGLDVCLRRQPHPIHERSKFGALERFIQRFLELIDKSPDVDGTRRVIEAESSGERKQRTLMDSAHPGPQVLTDYHAVCAHEPVKQGLDRDRPHPHLAVGNADAVLYGVSGHHIVPKPLADHLDIHVCISQPAAHHRHAKHVPDDRDSRLKQLQVIHTPVAVAQDSPGRAVQRAQHLDFLRAAEPAGHLVDQELRGFLEHPRVVVCRDAEIAAQLPVGGAVEFQRLHAVLARAVQHAQDREAAVCFHHHFVGAHQIVLLDLALANQFLAQLLQGQTYLHVSSPPSFCAAPVTRSR